MIYLGIDPGVNGAVATSEGWAEHLPVIGKPKKRALEARKLYSLLAPHVQHKPALAAVELQWQRPGGSPMSANQSGKIYGGTLAVLQLLGVAYVEVAPATWKRYFGLGRDKRDSIALAEHEYANAEDLITGPRGGKDHDLAEALCLALYAEIFLGRSHAKEAI